MGMHPVAKFNLGKGNTIIKKYHIQVSGNNGNGGSVSIEPTHYPYWKNDNRSIVAEIGNVDPNITVLFGRGVPGRHTRDFTLHLVLPENTQFITSNLFSFTRSTTLPGPLLEYRDLTSEYRGYFFDFKDSYDLRTNNRYDRRDILVFSYKGVYFNININLRVV